MLPRSLLAGAFASLFCLSVQVARADTFTFDNLTNGGINGQDGWISIAGNPSVMDGFGVDTTKIVGGNEVAQHARSGVPTAANSSVLTFDANLQSSGQASSLFGLADPSGSNGIAFGLNVPGNGPNAGIFSFELFDRSTLFNTDHAIYVTMPGGTTADWYRLRLIIDYTANGGDGSGSLYAQDLTLGDTGFTPITGMQNINLGMTAANMVSYQPANETNLTIYVTGGGVADNLSTDAAATPEPNVCALLASGGLSGNLFLRRRFRPHRKAANQ